MINFIIFLTKKFSFIDLWIKQFIVKYESLNVFKLDKAKLEENSKKHLQLINDYQKLGLQPPKVYKRPKEGV